jgi:lipopolysaccharide assembly outer membrane protein LptD (OstA)
LLLPGLLNAQADADRQAGNRTPRAASVVQADRLIDRVRDGEPVTDLLGNVYIDRDTVTARSDTARYWRRSEIYEMWGNVKLRQFETVLSCDRAIYYRNRGSADFFGSVRIEEADVIGTGERGESREQGQLLRLFESARLVSPDYTVWADTIVRDRTSEESEAFGNVKIVDTEAQTLVTGDHAVFAGDGSTARVDRRPSLTTREQQGVPLESWAGVMYFYQDDQRIVMVDSVQIRQGATEAAADTAVFLGRETLILRGDPQVWIGKRSTMVGEEIEFRYRNQQLNRIVLTGQARMEDSTPDSLAQIYSGLPPLDVLEGDTITVSIDAGRVQRTVTLGNAHSVYVPTDLEDEVAYNDVYGDTIIIYFREDQVDRVDVMGNMKGTYTFARLANLAPLEGKFVPGIPALDSTAVPAPARAGCDSTAMPGLAGIDSTAMPGLAGIDSTAMPARAGIDSATSPTTGAIDSSAVVVAGKYDFRSGAEKVTYSGHAVEFQMAKRTIDIHQESELTYGTMTLTADEVTFDTVKRELYADGDPLLVESDQKLVGDKMGYNFDYKSGAVKDGTTSFEQRYYDGQEIKRFDDGSLKIKSGHMTSCDLEDPHYRFWSHKMKLKLEDKVVAKPVVLYIGKVPTFALPFYFKSLKSGRRSGVLFPNFNFGWSGRDGRYIRDLGYFWATNDYMDFTFLADYNERENWNFRINHRYVKRYSFRGGVQYTWRQTTGDRPDEREWQFRWNHDQEKLFDVYSLRGNVNLSSRTLSSNDLSREIGRDVVSGQLRSNLTLSRSWNFMNGSATLSRDQRVNADDDDPQTDNVLYSQVVPQVSLGFRRIPLRGQLSSGQQGSFAGNLLRDTYFTQAYTFQLNQEEREVSSRDTYQASGRWSLDIRPPRISIFSLNLGASASQNWTSTQVSGQQFAAYDTSYTEPDSTLVLTPIFVPLDGDTEETRPSLSFSTGLNTTLYGVLPVQVGALQAIRHTFRFSASHSYRPSLGSKQIRSQAISFNLNNRFDIKYLSGSANDSTPEFKKLDGILDWGLTTSYNPDATNRRFWSNLGSNINIRPGQSRNLNVRVSNSIDPYLWKILNTRLTYGLNFSGRINTGGKVAEVEQPVNKALERLGVSDSTATAVEGFVPPEQEYEMLMEEESDTYPGFERPGEPLGGGQDPTEGGQFIPWNFSASLSYNNDNISGRSSARTNMTLSTNLSRKWEFRYRLSYDIILGQAIRQEYTLYRDLHCWRLEFSRIISDVDSQYGFRIYLVDIPALKLTQGNDQLLGSLGSGSLY